MQNHIIKNVNTIEIAEIGFIFNNLSTISLKTFIYTSGVSFLKEIL
nr:MAG TPA: hypothetical protein [Caudoviricetes sp.]